MSLSVNINRAFYGDRAVLGNIRFEVKEGGMLGIIGETGSGKTTLARIISNLQRFYNLHVDGDVKSSGKISYIPQNVTESLDPLFTIEYQMREINDSTEEIRRALERVGFEDVERVLSSYPHNLSGGMQQRVLIAMALLEGKIIVADEFTSALDRTTKRQIVELLKRLNRQYKTTVVFITHDVELLEFEGLLLVMFMGEMVEFGDVERLKREPYHPYIKALLESVPREGMHYSKDRFREITINREAACPFVDICDKADRVCYSEKPPLKKVKERLVRCHF